MYTITALSFLLGSVYAHSWVRCTDYKAAITGGDYDESQCEGWIRGWEYDGITFGQDRGINYQVGLNSNQPLCQSPLSGSPANDYGFDADKVPRYTAGETVRVVWPAKNHANYECFNFIPDTSMKLFFNPNVNPTQDLANSESTMIDQGYELVKDWHDGCTPGEDGCGFQNCPKFCENTDKATCFGDFEVPIVDTSGYYTFVWYWIFNPGSPYITCWEAYIEADGSATEPSAPSSPTATGAPAPLPTPSPTTGTNPRGDIIGYLTQIPVCVTGLDYNANALAAFVADEFVDVDSVTATYILSFDETDDGYNFVAQVSHDNAGAEVTDIATIEFCTNFQTVYSSIGTPVTCDVSDDCGEVITFALYEYNRDDDDDNTTPTANPVENPGTAPTPIPASSTDAIVVSNNEATQAYYLSFVLDHIDDCYSNIDAVQLDMGNGNYVSNDQYYYDNGHKYAFNYVATRFSDLLPISLRILFNNGDFVDLDNIIADLEGNSVFTSGKTCDGGDATVNVPTPAPTSVLIVEETTEEDTNADTGVPTSMETTPILDGLSGATFTGTRGLVYIALLVLAMFCL